MGELARWNAGGKKERREGPACSRQVMSRIVAGLAIRDARRLICFSPSGISTRTLLSYLVFHTGSARPYLCVRF